MVEPADLWKRFFGMFFAEKFDGVLYLKGKKVLSKACLPHDEYQRPLFYVVANEPVLVKGYIYPEGAEIPDSVWNPAYLEVALRIGTVRRRNTLTLASEDSSPFEGVRKRFVARNAGSRRRRVS